MCSSTSSQGSGLVRTVEPCAQTRVAIETHSQMRGAKCCMFGKPAEQATESERRGGRFFVIPVDSLIDSEQERHHCTHSLVSSSSCFWPAMRGVAYEQITAFHLHLRMRTLTSSLLTTKQMIPFQFSMSMYC